MAVAFSFKNGVGLTCLRGRPPPFCVKPAGVFLQMIQLPIIECLIEMRDMLVTFVGDFDSASVGIRHGKVTIEPAPRHTHDEGMVFLISTESRAEEITEWAVDAWLVLAIPVGPKQ